MLDSNFLSYIQRCSHHTTLSFWRSANCGYSDLLNTPSTHHSVKFLFPKTGTKTLHFLLGERPMSGLNGFPSWQKLPDGGRGSSSLGQPVLCNSWKLNLESVSSAQGTILCSLYIPQDILFCLIKSWWVLFSRTKITNQWNLSSDGILITLWWSLKFSGKTYYHLHHLPKYTIRFP